MKKIALNLEKIGKPFWVILGLLLLLIVSTLDYVTGTELSFSLFYLIPIILFAWSINGTAGIIIASVSAGIWFVIELISGPEVSLFVNFWNAIIRLGFFLVPVLLIRNLEHEKEHARTDFLTGAMNTRSFHDVTQSEIDRSVRYQRPFTVAFIDIDNFKTVNDTFGHAFGDMVLRVIAQSIKRNLRKTDTIARVGGDEFALLLPETDTDTARIAISKMQKRLQEEMTTKKWPVTFSIGVISLNAPQLSVDDILGLADKLMYSVKNYGKDNIKYAAH
ncbi:MAG: GGDEF domain-containing protein [Anaerolineales bacterium]|nr:GGDEF domain-containing protein [Anaerolineales bacterium]